MNIFDPSQFSNDCAPIYSDDSIFFNLILNSNYENTKENCLLFLRNYSKRIHYTKRDIFRIIINELTLGDNSSLNIGKDESIYLIRQIIKKYSRNNIINALYDFVSLNEDENMNENSLSNQEKNSNNYTNDFTNDRTQNSERGESKKDMQKIMNIINKKDKKKKEKKESDKKEKEKDKKIENSIEGDILADDNSVDKLLKFLEKKRKSSNSNYTKKEKEKKDKRPKKEQNEKKENKEKEEKEKKNKSKLKKEREKKDEKLFSEEDKINDEEIEKGDVDEEKEIKEDKKDKKENEELKMDNCEEKNIKEEKEKIEINIKNETNDFEKEEKNKTKEKMLIKKEDNFLRSHNEANKFQRRSYKNRMRNMNCLSPFKSFISKSISGISSPIEIIKLESVEDTNGEGNNIISPTKHKRSKDKIKSSNQLDILSYLNLSKTKRAKPSFEQMNKFGNHLIKDLKEKTFIYSYRIKRYQSFKNNIILFECNNNKCLGRGEYDVEKKIFKETIEHNVPANLHKLAFAHYNVRQNLLMDDCLGYQLFKDNNNFIKDKKVILLNI